MNNISVYNICVLRPIKIGKISGISSVNVLKHLKYSKVTGDH